MDASLMNRKHLCQPKQVTLPVWRTFVPGAFTAFVEYGLLARFIKVDSKLVITGIFPKGSVISKSEQEGQYQIVYKAISRTVLKPVEESSHVTCAKPEFSQVLDILVLRNIGSSEDRIVWLLSQYIDGRDLVCPVMQLGTKAIAVCAMLSVRQVTRILPQLEAAGVIRVCSDKSIEINPNSNFFTKLKVSE